MCGFCGKINKNYLCDNCNKIIKSIEKNNIDVYERNFDKHLYIFKYEGIIRKKIIDYKFGDKAYLYKTFQKIILNNKKVCDFINSYDIIIPVPIHNKRKMERGYNQSLLIIKEMTRYIENIKIDKDTLVKKVNVERQSSLSKKDRTKNIIGAYYVKNKKNIEGKNVLIFDDVFTTGSTVDECAKVLKESGTKNIGVFTIAKD